MVKTGDRVKFLNDSGGGIVKGFIGKNLVKVENEDGFEIPTLVSELVVIEEEPEKQTVRTKPAGTTNKTEPAKPTTREEQPKSVLLEGKNKPSFFLAFVPENATNPVGGDINIWLVNDSNFTVIYHFSHQTEKGYETVKTGKTGPNSRSRLETLVQSGLADLPGYNFHLIPYMEKDKRKIEPVSKSFQVNPVKFYKEKSFTPTSFFTSNAMLLEISGNMFTNETDTMTDAELKEVLRIKKAESMAPPPAEPKPLIPEILEVDLHIHQLVDSTQGIENRDIIEIQLKKFLDEMERAIRNGVKRVVFIHGIGQGTLKNEIRKELSTRYKKYSFQDASFKEYGYGATMVILKK